MNNQGLFIVFGSLGLFVIMITIGFSIPDSIIASLLRIFGILGVFAWICFALYLANAMNTDI